MRSTIPSKDTATLYVRTLVGTIGERLELFIELLISPRVLAVKSERLVVFLPLPVPVYLEPTRVIQLKALHLVLLGG